MENKATVNGYLKGKRHWASTYDSVASIGVEVAMAEPAQLC